jgi:type IV secretory pathway VirB10-like protein
MYAVWMTVLRAPTLTKRFPADPKVALHALASSYTVMARNAIFVLLVGGINSDLPGPIFAQVRTGLSKAT